MKKDEFRQGLLFLTLSNQYLHLVKNIVGENLKQGNLWLITSDEMFDISKYNEMTRWSDFIIGTPVFFNFYHGLELLLKGLLLLRKDYILKQNHHIDSLLNDFRNNYTEAKEITCLLEKYLIMKSMPKFLSDCLIDNNIETNNLYEFFRYPFDKKLKREYDYSKLKYREKEGLKFFGEFLEDIGCLLKEEVRIYRDIGGE